MPDPGGKMPPSTAGKMPAATFLRQNRFHAGLPAKILLDGGLPPE
jgi:hypothetical protein